MVAPEFSTLDKLKLPLTLAAGVVIGSLIQRGEEDSLASNSLPSVAAISAPENPRTTTPREEEPLTLQAPISQRVPVIPESSKDTEEAHELKYQELLERYEALEDELVLSRGASTDDTMFEARLRVEESGEIGPLVEAGTNIQSSLRNQLEFKLRNMMGNEPSTYVNEEGIPYTNLVSVPSNVVSDQVGSFQVENENGSSDLYFYDMVNGLPAIQHISDDGDLVQGLSEIVKKLRELEEKLWALEDL